MGGAAPVAWADEAGRDGEVWEYFLAAGAVSEEQARELASKIWEPATDEDDEWDEDADGEGAADGEAR